MAGGLRQALECSVLGRKATTGCLTFLAFLGSTGNFEGRGFRSKWDNVLIWYNWTINYDVRHTKSAEHTVTGFMVIQDRHHQRADILKLTLKKSVKNVMKM